MADGTFVQTILVNNAVYSPPNWNPAHKALYAITFNSGGQTTVDADGTIHSTTSRSENGYNPETGMTMFVFDAIRRAEHSLFADVTQHPLQTGFNISDHMIMQPVRLRLEVSMSDAIAAYTTNPTIPMWGGNPSKSVSAFQQMEKLMRERQLMTLNTRLETYANMVLTNIAVEDTNRTFFGGLSMTVSFQQVIVADVAAETTPARPQTSNETTQGQTQALPPDVSTTVQHQLPATQTPATVPGAGSWSSRIWQWFQTPLQFAGGGQ